MANLTAEEYRGLADVQPKTAKYTWAGNGSSTDIVSAVVGAKIVITKLCLSIDGVATEIQVKDDTTLLGNYYMGADSPVAVGNGKGVIFVTTAGNPFKVDPVGATNGTMCVVYKEVFV